MDEPNDVKCVQQAVAAVVAGNADVLMKGLVSTDKYMRGILNKEAGLFPPKGVLSHVSIVEMPCYHKLLVISDVAVIPLPDFKQKTVQIGYLARTANLLGIKTPKIACIAPSEQLLPNVVSTEARAVGWAWPTALGDVVVTVRCRSTWRSTRRWPNTRRYGVRPSRAIRTACSSPIWSRPTSSSSRCRTSAAANSRPW